jgi:16S rRNA (adenine1518-N6/adenine1519-N6)-dimethyltransferase
VANPILFRLLFEAPRPTRIVAMLQTEVAERIVGARGRLTFLGAAVGSVADAQIVRRVAPGSFFPMPRVRSAVVRLDRRPAPMVAEGSGGRFVDFLRAGFAQPRKQLRNSLAQGLAVAAAEIDLLASSVGIDPRRRPEQLSLHDWLGLFEAFERNGRQSNR